MATQKQIDANRRNAELSTGPQTPEGKQVASLNALQSGIYAESTVIPGEDPTALLALTAEYYGHHRPAAPEARALVDSPIHHEWILRRLRHSEAAVYNCDCSQCETRYAETSEAATISGRLACELPKLEHLQRRINSTERNYHRSLKALQALELNPEPSGEAATT